MIRTNNTEWMRVTADGNVGIGTSSPSVRLSLGNDNANTKLAIWDGGTSGVMGFGVSPSQFRIHLPSPSNRFSFLDAPSGNEVMTILGSGNVGIGTSSPQARLHVSGTAFFTQGNTTFQVLPNQLFGQTASNAATLEIPGNGTLGIWDALSVQGNMHVGGNLFTLGGGTDPTWRRVSAGVDPAGGGLYVGFFKLLGANGNNNVMLSYITGFPNHGAITVYDEDGNQRAGMYVEDNGTGALWAGVKLFRVPDPDVATRDIWYGCIEGPELAMYVRGTARLVNGRARIELPDHFRKLADEQGMTVQLTPRSAESKGLAAVQVSLNGIEVVELLNGRGNYEFDWRVEAVRKEHRDFRVYRPWDEVMPAGTDRAQAWEARLKSIQDRQARQQGSPSQRRLERLEQLFDQTAGGNRGSSQPDAWLGDNIPNPHEGTTVIPYYVPSGVGSAELVIEDGAGRRVLGFVLSERGVSGQVVVRMEQLASGRYEYRLVLDGRVVSSKAMQLVR